MTDHCTQVHPPARCQQDHLVPSSNDNNPGQAFRARDHRFSSLPVKSIIRIRMEELDISNRDLQQALGYTNANVVAMLRHGSMRLPEHKVVAVADMLQLDRAFLLGKVMGENSPALWATLQTVLGERLVTANELTFIQVIRTALDGHDAPLAASQALLDAMAPVLAAIYKVEEALKDASLRRADR